ncbi:MAG TPA: twin-arginine translocase TatA/TatE family subunit [Lacipirellulaceae bacterium]|nr:twin-arginine translocase TatA/TatE family subunit [Lacipirellulaceae bacterium]
MGELLKLLLILVILILLFSHRLPSIARSLGQSVSEFRKGVKELENQSDNDKSE